MSLDDIIFGVSMAVVVLAGIYYWFFPVDYDQIARDRYPENWEQREVWPPLRIVESEELH
jgi:hypothetical protein